MNRDPGFEQSRYLITELETLVNGEYLNLLKDSPHNIMLRGFKPPEEYKAPDIIRLELGEAGLVEYGKVSVDADFTLPTDDPYGDIENYHIAWQNGVNWNYAKTENGPVAYASHGDHIYGEPAMFSIDHAQQLIEAAGLPFDLMSSKDPRDVEQLITTFSRYSDRFNQTRERILPLNPYSSLRVIHDATLFRQDESEEPYLLQELRLEVRHYEDFGKDYPAGAVLSVNTSHPVHAEHIVFRRDPTDVRWAYCGTYNGPVRPGELPGEYEEQVDQLIAPPIRLAIQINEALEKISEYE